jgi:hypothetical protein
MTRRTYKSGFSPDRQVMGNCGADSCRCGMTCCRPCPSTNGEIGWVNLAAWLADFGGKAMVDPPRIAWQSPSEFAGDVETPTP